MHRRNSPPRASALRPVELTLGQRPQIPGRRAVVTDATTDHSRAHAPRPMTLADLPLRLYLRNVLGQLLPPVPEQPSTKDRVAATADGIADTRDVPHPFRLTMPAIRKAVTAPLEVSDTGDAVRTAPAPTPPPVREVTPFTCVPTVIPPFATPPPKVHPRIDELSRPKSKVVRARIVPTDVYPPESLDETLTCIAENRVMERRLQAQLNAAHASRQQQQDAIAEFQRRGATTVAGVGAGSPPPHKEEGQRRHRDKRAAHREILRPDCSSVLRYVPDIDEDASVTLYPAASFVGRPSPDMSSMSMRRESRLPGGGAVGGKEILGVFSPHTTL